MDPFTILLAYLSIIPAYVFSCLVLILLGKHFLPEMYINILEPLFSYAAVIMGQRSQSIADLDSEDSKNAYDDKLIERDVTLTEDGIEMSQTYTIGEEKYFKLYHPCYLIKSGIEAIIEDDVTQRFSSAELRVWNLLARNQNFYFYNTKYSRTLYFLWFVGFVVRYLILFPSRLSVCLFGVGVTWFVGFLKTCFPNSRLGKWLSGPGYQKAMLLNLCAYAPVIRFHNPENRPAANTICVANHTTPVDFAVLASDNTYAVVGQKQGGFFGLVEEILSSAVPTIWFDRSETFDRSAVARRLREHVAMPGAPPILIFPEGTCINNTSVMKFKKGCFEVGAVIHPVAIRYDPRYADCFWNSSQDSLFQYLLKMMTSWALVVDVWYLPPERPLPGEDGIQFAARVKRIIAKQGGLTAMDWDGELKRSHPKPTLKLTQQKLFSEMISSEE
uniref:Phospholipid/glycerol acyltransferase domain-containing protein n=2 Tax=Schistocephalus solidus TaxID=70667 RepID=A0A0V0J5A8_SCHSO